MTAMIGYKATNADMTCRGHKFELGVWYEVEGELEMCGNGFHFCEHMSGVWAYYSDPDTRIFKCEAEDVSEQGKDEPGADKKRVAKRIRLVEEVSIAGDGNTGNWNTGDWNTGNWNTGNWNTGDWNTGHRNTGHGNTGDGNTGHWNTGDWNTGYRNTGHWNTGHWNTGHWNTGDWNTGHRNTGYGNTGDRNTGDGNTGYRNTGDWNTGNWNATNFSSGFFCAEEPFVLSFDVQTTMRRGEFLDAYPESHELGRLLMSDTSIEFSKFSRIPGITPEKLKALHDKHIQARTRKE